MELENGGLFLPLTQSFSLDSQALVLFGESYNPILSQLILLVKSFHLQPVGDCGMFPLSFDNVSLCFVLSPYFLAAQETPGPSCIFAVAAKSQPSAPMCGSFYCRTAMKTKILASVGYQRMHSEQCIQDAQAKMLKCTPNSNKQGVFICIEY